MGGSYTGESSSKMAASTLNRNVDKAADQLVMPFTFTVAADAFPVFDGTMVHVPGFLEPRFMNIREMDMATFETLVNRWVATMYDNADKPMPGQGPSPADAPAIGPKTRFA
jgi:hypothetical protein